jgi:hypothetical protein
MNPKRKPMLVCVIEAALLASTVAVQAQFDFTTNDGSITITGYTTVDPTVLDIPDTINGLPVTSIGEDAFYGCWTLTSDGYAIINSATNYAIPNSVTNIGDYAFFNCTGLTRLIIDSSMVSIGELSFEGCTSPKTSE